MDGGARPPKRSFRVNPVDRLGRRMSPAVHDAAEEIAHRAILHGEKLHIDPAARDMFYRRTQEFSWDEIGLSYGISGHAAESRFSQALRKIRERLDPKSGL